MVSALLKSLIQAGVYYGISEVLFRGKQAEYRIRDVLFAAAILFLAVLVGFWGILALVLALFFQLADLFSYVQPALIVGGLLVAGALGLFWEGKILLTRNKRSKIHP